MLLSISLIYFNKVICKNSFLCLINLNLKINTDLPDDFIETKDKLKQVSNYENLNPHLKKMYKEQSGKFMR